MTDAAWVALRERWRRKVKNGDLKCGENMVPFAVGNDGVFWQWVSRSYVENCDKLASDPAFKKSMASAYQALMAVHNDLAADHNGPPTKRGRFRSIDASGEDDV